MTHDPRQTSDAVKAALRMDPGPTRDHSTYIGGSKIAALMGVNPFADSYDIYRELVHREQKEPTAKMELGNALERYVLELVAADSGLTFEYPGTLTVPGKEFLAATPDAVEYTSTVQMKTLNPLFYLSDAWGPDGSGYVPDHVFYQANWEAGVFRDCYGREPSFARVIPYCGTAWRMHICEFDASLYELCKEEAERFWVDHVVAKRPPLKQDRPPPPEWVTEEGYAALVERYLELRAEESAIAEEKKDIAAALRRAASRSNIETSVGTVRVLESKGRVNWNALSHDLMKAGFLTKRTLETYRGPMGHRIEVRERKH